MSDTESSTPAPTPTCPLLKLPPEIRNRIWTLVFEVEGVFIKCNANRKPSGEHLPPTKVALAFTCRQIYREVTPIYYSKNVFCFHFEQPLDVPWQFAAAIGPANAESITAIGFYSSTETTPFSPQSLKELLPFPNLKTLWDLDFHGTRCGPP